MHELMTDCSNCLVPNRRCRRWAAARRSMRAETAMDGERASLSPTSGLIALIILTLSVKCEVFD